MGSRPAHPLLPHHLPPPPTTEGAQLAGGAGEASWAPVGGDASQREHPTPNGVQGGESCSREHRARRQADSTPLVPARGHRASHGNSRGSGAAPRGGEEVADPRQPRTCSRTLQTRGSAAGDQAHRTKSQRSKMSRGRRNVTSISGLRRVCYENALKFQIARWGSSQPSVQLPRGRPGGGRGGGRRRSRRQVPVCREPCGLSLGAHA